MNTQIKETPETQKAMKKYFALRFQRFASGCVLTAALMSTPVYAAGANPEATTASAGWRFFGGVDYLAAANADSTLTRSSDICQKLIAQNGGTGSSCSASSKAYGAEGFRVELFRKDSGIELGASVGYLAGGPGVGTKEVRINGAPRKGAVTSSASTLRLLSAGRRTWNISGPLSLRMGAGLGVAVVNRTSSAVGFDASAGTFYAPGYSKLGWLTWELSPALVYRGISLGCRYAGFARGGQMPWNSYGAFIGFDF